MRRNYLLGVLLLACVTFAQTPGDVVGQWQGSIEVPGSPLEILVTFTTDTSAALTGTVDIPAQGAQGLPLMAVALEGSALTFAIQGTPGNPTFEGTLSGDTIKGAFSQSGGEFPFTLTRENQAVTGAETGGAATTSSESGGAAGSEVSSSPKEALERLFTDTPTQADWFADGFLAVVPVAQLEAILKSLTDQLGTYESVEGDSSPFTVKFSKGTTTTQIVLDPDGKISGLLFTDIVPNIGSVDEAVAQIAALPGQTSVLVLKNGEEVAAHNADTPLGVGSALKLAVLAALQDQIAAGTHTWDEVVTLKPEWKSLPSGILQDWPDGTKLTLQTLATLMISISDNTATDALISIVGRDAVEAQTEHNRPFLTTQEAFKLKDPQNSELLKRYLAGEEAAKREVLTELVKLPFPGAEVFSGAPVALEVEWFFTPRELCSLMAKVQALPLMSVSPGPVNPADWQRVAYKGGSEPGVLNLTTWLTDKDGSSYCVTVTQNNPDAPVDETALVALYGGLVGALE